ncbi:MAG: restriction endonuclease subunit S, partial [Desulfuromonadales bacterium]|nr:restriction endonuclease subunit S [Desulfuromonadales bacterium]
TDVYYNSRITKKLNFMQATATEREILKFTLKKGDVVITKDSETPGDIAVPAYVSENLGGVVCGYHLAILRPLEGRVDGEYLSYLLSLPKTRYYFFTLATGATRFGLSVGGIGKAHFKLPAIDEQQKIASVLSAADREIEVLQQELDNLKQQKRALMQQLLTGKRRVTI